MTKDEILQAIRLTAMGRAGHPLQEELAEKLAQLLETPEQRAEREMGGVTFQVGEILVDGPVVMEAAYTYSEAPVVIDDQTKAKRRKKAD